MKKIVALILVFALVLSTTACGDNKTEENSGNSSNKDNGVKEKIVIWTQAAPDHPEGKMFANRIEAYNAENPDAMQVEIQNFTRAGSGSGYIDKLNAAITSNQMPDIFTLDGPDVASYVEAGVIRSLDDILDTAFVNGFTDAMIEQGTVNSELYALGYQDSGVVVMYNEDVINELPENVRSIIPGPDEDWTWTEFYEVANEVNALRTDPEFQDKEHISKLELTVDFLTSDIPKGAYEIAMYFLLPMIWSNNANVVAEDGLTLDGYLDSPETIEALKVFGDFFANDLALAIEPEKSFHTGKAAMAIGGFWFINDLTSNYPSTKFRSVRYPKMDADFDGNYTPSGSWAFVASNNVEQGTDKAEQVGDVLEWLTNDEAAEEYYHANGAIPGRTNAVSVIDTDTENPYHNEAWHVLKYQVENTNKARPISVGYPYLSETFARDVIMRIAQNEINDTETIEQYVDDAIKKIKFEFDRYQK
jgi:fructooligosaccharide transport system substrate-binding protein